MPLAGLAIRGITYFFVRNITVSRYILECYRLINSSEIYIDI